MIYRCELGVIFLSLESSWLSCFCIFLLIIEWHLFFFTFNRDTMMSVSQKICAVFFVLLARNAPSLDCMTFWKVMYKKKKNKTLILIMWWDTKILVSHFQVKLMYISPEQNLSANILFQFIYELISTFNFIFFLNLTKYAVSGPAGQIHNFILMYWYWRQWNYVK